MSHEDNLTPREIAFIDEYVNNGFDAKSAYLLISPGVSGETAGVGGCNYLKKDKIKNEIERRRLNKIDKHDIKLSFLVEELKGIIEDSKGDTKSDRVSILKAIDLLAKLGGFYINKTEITTNIEQPLFKKKED